MAQKMVLKLKKWDYIITGIWYMEMNETKYISHVIIHECVTYRTHAIGKKVSKNEVIRLIEAKQKICTAMWNYSTSGFLFGAKVGYEEIDGTKYLRSDPDKTTENNLHNLIDMAEFELKF